MYKILIVDDDKISHKFIARALGGQFLLTDVFSGEEALETLRNHDNEKPDLILLDVEMPGLNGYEVCEQIKSQPETAKIPVVFLSARNDIRSQMQGFDAGADDYIVKPFQAEKLIAKIKVVGQYVETRKELSSKVQEAEHTALIAISGSSDLGQAIQFIERSHHASNHEQLAKNFFIASNNMGLNCTLLIKANDQDLFFSSKGEPVNPIESGLISKLVSENRFFDFGCRTQINYPKISVLIKNMPLDDMEHYGRIKDMLPALLGSANIKINQINTQAALTEQLNEANGVFAEISQTLDVIKQTLQTQQKEGIKIMRSMLLELDRDLPGMALDEDQEQYILDRVDQAIEKAYKSITDTHSTNASFNTVLTNLKILINRQQSLLDQMNKQEEEQSESENLTEGYEMDVELF